jgi:hypothetical protein
VVQINEQMTNGFAEQHYAFQHNATLMMQLGQRLERLEKAQAEGTLSGLSGLKTALEEPLLAQVSARLEALEARMDARLLGRCANSGLCSS